MFWFLTTTPAQINPLLCYCTVIWPTNQFKSTHFLCCVLFSEYHNSSNPPVTKLVFCCVTTHNCSNPPDTTQVYAFLTTTVQISIAMLEISFLNPTPVQSHLSYGNVLLSHPHTNSDPPVSMLMYCFLTFIPVQIHRWLCCVLFSDPPHQFKSTCFYAGVLNSDHYTGSHSFFVMLCTVSCHHTS